MINFWAVWCAPCLQEMPELNKLYDKYKDQGLKILAVSTDNESERDLIAPFVKARNLKFPVLYGDGIQKLFRVNGIPASIFIGKEGQIRFQNTGFHGADEMQRNFQVIINELLK